MHKCTHSFRMCCPSSLQVTPRVMLHLLSTYLHPHGSCRLAPQCVHCVVPPVPSYSDSQAACSAGTGTQFLGGPYAHKAASWRVWRGGGWRGEQREWNKGRARMDGGKRESTAGWEHCGDSGEQPSCTSKHARVCEGGGPSRVHVLYVAHVCGSYSVHEGLPAGAGT